MLIEMQKEIDRLKEQIEKNENISNPWCILWPKWN
jgi:hypothetical protein